MLALALDISCVGVPSGGGVVHVLTGAATESDDTAAAVATNVLKLVVSSATGNTGDSITVTGHGGVGSLTIDIQTNNDNGFLLSQSTYVCGPTSGTTTLRVTDSLSNTATATVVVTAPSGQILWLRNSDFAASNSTPMTDRSPVGGNININGGPLTGTVYAAINSKRALDLDGSTQYLVTAANRTHGPDTMVVVAKFSGTAGQIMHTISGSSSYMFATTGNSINETRGSTSGKNLSANWGINANFRTLMKRFDGTHAGHTLRINGVDQSLTNGTGTSDPGTGTFAAPVAIGARSDTGGNKCTGSIASAMMFDRKLTDAEAGQIETYYQKLFGHY